MDANQVGSINFDANALYLEEDSEHEDDKQQDNELQALISQGGLGDLDDSLLSSSGDSDSYEDSDSSESGPKSTNHLHHQVGENNNDQVKPTSPRYEGKALNEPDTENKMHQAIENINNNNNENQQDESLFAHNLDQTAAPSHLITNNADNFLIRNQYSTPSANQNAPPPQMLQATAIPTINEDVFYRQRNNNPNQPANNPTNNVNQVDTNESIPNFQQPAGILQQQYSQPVYLLNDQANHDQTIGMEPPSNANRTAANNKTSNDYNQNYAALQQQHYIPHSKLHSMERFAVPSSIMPPPAPQSHNHHEHLTNDHELSLNETDTEDDNGYKNNNLEPQTPINNFNPMAAYANGGIQLEFSENGEKNAQKISNENNNLGKKKQQCEETSIIDLNELDEAQLKQLQAEEEKQQQEYFNIDHLNRLYCQAQFLYKIRGKKLEEVTNRFTAYQEDMSREIRAMKHRLYLAEKEKDGVTSSLDQAHSLCNQYKAETDLAKNTALEMQEKAEKLKTSNRILEQKLAENEEEIENLQVQIGEQQKLDTLERVQEQHEHFIQQLRDQFEKELMQMREAAGETQNVLQEKMELIRMLTLQLETAGQNAERAAVERADTINRLTKNLNDLQTKYDQEILIAAYNNKQNSLPTNDTREAERKLSLLQDKCTSLEEQVRAYETLKLGTTTFSNATSDDFHLSRLSHTNHPAEGNSSANETMTNTLQRELERALTTIKQKRNESQAQQNEIEQLKNQLLATNSDLDKIKTKTGSDLQDTLANLKTHELEYERLNNAIDELQREKIELSNEIIDKNTKLDEMMEQEEQFQHLKNNLELDIYSKQQYINDLQEKLANLSQSLNNQKILNEYEAQIVELKLKVTNREHEVQKTREMYIEICNDKNNLQDTLKVQYDQEYAAKLKSKIDTEVVNRLEDQKKELEIKWDEEKSVLVLEHRQEIEKSLDELRKLKEKLVAAEHMYEKLKEEKTEFTTKMKELEVDLKEKCAKLQSDLSQSNENHQNEINQKSIELTDLKKDYESQLTAQNTELNGKLTSMLATIANLENQLSSEKQNLSTKIEAALEAKTQLANENASLSQQFQIANAKINEYEVKLKQTDTLKQQETDAKFQQLQEKLTNNHTELEMTKTLLNKANGDLIEIRNKLNNSEKELITKMAALTECEKKLKATEEQIKIAEKNFTTEIDQLKEELTTKLDQAAKNSKELTDKHELAKQAWIQERSQIIVKKEEEFQKYMEQLEKRFEEDYATFMQTHKDAIQRTLSEKSVEFAKEKDKLVDMYEKKLIEYDTTEMCLKKQIKDLEQKRTKKLDICVQTTPVKQPSPRCSDKSSIQDEERVNNLLDKISSLEELIGNADAHFEQEIDRLRQELDEDYQMKLKCELEREEGERQQLIGIIEELKGQLKLDSNDSNSYMNGHDITDFDFISSTSSNPTDRQNTLQYKHAKLKEELDLRDKELDTIEQAYRTKIHKLQEHFNNSLKDMQQKHQADIDRIKQELSDHFKQSTAKTKSELERMQSVVQKLKKTNSDSDKVIDSLKMEMNKMKEGHLNELTHLKMGSEREKESLKEKCEQYVQRISSLEMKLEENEERLKEQCDELRANLKQEYGMEVSKVQAKMKEMMKIHAEQLKHGQQNSKLAGLYETNKTCQTETSSKDIELLETFRQKYLETLAKMKSDMMKEFDAQTQRVSERVSRQINEERKIIQEKMHGILMPKVIDILRDHNISEKLIEVQLRDLQRELIQITTLKSSKPSSSGSSSASSSLRSTSKLSLLNVDNENTSTKSNQLHSDLKSISNQNLKYSISSHLNKTSPSKTNDESLPLYSKSASSIRDLQSVKTNHHLTSNNNKSIENFIVDNSNRHTPRQNPSTDSTKNPTKSPPTLSGGYKYTPLRQSWSNLTQLNSVSSYSTPSHTNEQTNKKLEEILHEESDRESNYCLSPQLSSKKHISSRPQTADSVYGNHRQRDANQQTLPEQVVNAKEHTSIASSDSLFSSYSGSKKSQEDARNGNRFDTDCFYFDDDNQFSNTDDVSTNFYKKYRTQNIRQKKSNTRVLNGQESAQRPHSASNLGSSNFKLNNNLSSASNSNIENPIGTLYEMSKNYQPIENMNQKATSSSAYSSTTSSTSSRISNLNNYEEEPSRQQQKTSFNIYKSSGSEPKTYDSTSDYDIENETPIKLDSESLKKPTRKTQPILRTVTSVINTNSSTLSSAARLSSTSTTSNNNLTNVTPSAAFTHNSLARSRSRSSSRSQTPVDFIGSTTSHAYRNVPAVSTQRKQQGNLENFSSLNSPRSKISSLSSSTSQYIPLAKSQLMQKKKAFY